METSEKTFKKESNVGMLLSSMKWNNLRILLAMVEKEKETRWKTLMKKSKETSGNTEVVGCVDASAIYVTTIPTSVAK